MMMVSDWTLSICTAFFCLGAGLLAALSVSEFSDFSERTLKIGSVLSLLTLGLGSVLALSNLGRPEMILGVLRNPGSGLFWELIGAAGSILFAAIYTTALFRESEQCTTKTLSIIAAAFSFGLVIALGCNFMMPWRPVLNTFTLVLPFIGFFLLQGALTYCLLCTLEKTENRLAKYGTIATEGLNLIFLGCYVFYLWFGEETKEAVQILLEGSLSTFFWSGCVLLGAVIPTVLIKLQKTGPWLVAAAVTCVFISSGIWQSLLFTIGQATWHFFKS